MPNPFSDPIFRYISADGAVQTGSISDILDAARSRNLESLPGMKPHYRPPVITFLGIMEHLRRRYTTETEQSLSELTRSDAFDLYPRADLPGFLQAGIPDEIVAKGLTKGVSALWQEVDPLFYGVGHVSKLDCCDDPSDEDVAYALIAAADRRSVIKNGGGPRWAMMPVFLSTDATVGSEIYLLADAYDRAAMAGTTEGVFKKPKSINDHFPFLADPNITVDANDIAWPHVDSYRPFRMSKQDDGAIRCLKHAGKWDRFERLRKLPNFEPHLATTTGEDGRFYRPHERAITHQDGIAGLFGRMKTTLRGKAKVPEHTQDVIRASIMNLIDGEQPIRYARVCGIGSKNGKTLGYREVLIPLDGPFDENRAIEAGRILQNIVRRTADTLAKHADNVFAGAGSVSKRELTKAVGGDLARHVQAISSGQDEDSVVSSFNQKCKTEAFSTFLSLANDYRASGFDWLRIAEIENLLRKDLRHGLENVMTDTTPNDSAKYEGPESHYIALARKIMRHVGPSSSETSKRIRTSHNTEPTLDIWRIAADLGVPDAQILSSLAAIRTTAECGSLLSHVQGEKNYLGASLHRIDFSEDRMARLLEESGEALRTTVLSIAHNGRSKGIASIDWTYPTALLLADAEADSAACSALKSKIALSYCRNIPSRKKH